LAISSGDTYSGFIDRLAKEDMASFPIILKLYQKIFIHDTLKAGVYVWNTQKFTELSRVEKG